MDLADREAMTRLFAEEAFDGVVNLAAQAVEVATNDELRNRLTHAASLLVQRYSWSNIAQHQEDVWQQLMDQQ
jgi:glycosyltransferase involved in cell wall biosynthesis